MVLNKGPSARPLFVNRGRLTVAGASGEQIDSLKDNDFFGEEGLIYDTRSTVRATPLPPHRPALSPTLPLTHRSLPAQRTR